MGTELAGDENRARRNTAVQHAHRHLGAGDHHAVRARLPAAPPGADSQHGGARASRRRRIPERGVLHAVLRLRAACDRDLAGGGPHLHHADLGGAAGISDPAGTVERHPGDGAPAVCGGTGGAGLSIARIERFARPRPRAGDGGDLGGRHGLSEVGANRRRPDRDRGVATARRPGGHRRLLAGGRRIAALVAGASACAARMVFAGMAGSAFAYLLWFEIVRRLPATTASLAY